MGEKMIRFQTGLFLLAVLSHGYLSFSQSNRDDLIAWWDFENIQEGRVEDRATGIRDQIDGNFRILDGVTGKALKFDGFTTRVRRDEEEAPVIKGPFSIQAWVAPQAYPWNWCAVVNQEYQHQRGYFFGIDAEGRVGFHAAVARQWRQCISEQKISFMEWSFIAATFDPESGIKVYINGELAGSLSVQGDLLNDIEMEPDDFFRYI